MQKKRLIIGAGGVGNVAVRKSARMEDIYEEILLASRTKEKCDAIAKESGPVPVRTASIDADDVDALVRMIKEFKADLVLNVALPYQDLTIMEACLRCGVHYWTPQTMNPGMRLILSTLGSGRFMKGMRRQA